MTAINSSVKLRYATDKGTYRPGDLLTVQAALTNTTPLVAGVAITGTAIFSDNTKLNLTFYDNGTNGDTTSGDGIRGARITTLNIPGPATIVLTATQGLLKRIATAML